MYACAHEDTDSKLCIRKTNEAVMVHVATKADEASDVTCVFDLIQPDTEVSEDFLSMKKMSEGQKHLHLEKIKVKGKKIAQVEVCLQKVFMVVWGQFTKALQASLRGENGFKAAEKAYDCVWLLSKIRKHMLVFVEDGSPHFGLVDAKKTLLQRNRREKITMITCKTSLNSMIS